MREDFVRRLPGSRMGDFLEVVWKTSWKSCGRIPGSRLAQKSSRSEKPAYPNPDPKNLHLQKHSNGLKTEKISGILDRSTFIEHTKIHI